MSRKLQFKRGKKADLTTLAAGEPGFVTDEGKLYVGTGSANIPMAREDHTHTPSSIGAAAASHTHSPSSIGAAAASHTHTKGQITDFPTSLPASDVYAWAKAASKPGYTAAEVGAAAASHSHTRAQITDFPTSLPASDVPAWAKAASKPGYTAAEVGAAPAYSYGTADLTAGSSPLATGKLHFVYE